MRKIVIIVGTIILLIIVGFIFLYQNKEVFQEEMQISSVFKNGDEVPVKYTANGNDVNPPLEITGIPEGAKSLVLIIDDPDAPMGTWVHWLVWNILVNKTNLNIKEDSVPGIQGVNSWGKNEYGGPNPPPGKSHKYFFKVYALNDRLNLPKDSKKQELEKSMKGYILDKAELLGFYREF